MRDWGGGLHVGRSFTGWLPAVRFIPAKDLPTHMPPAWNTQAFAFAYEFCGTHSWKSSSHGLHGPDLLSANIPSKSNGITEKNHRNRTHHKGGLWPGSLIRGIKRTAGSHPLIKLAGRRPPPQRKPQRIPANQVTQGAEAPTQGR